VRGRVAALRRRRTALVVAHLRHLVSDDDHPTTTTPRRPAMDQSGRSGTVTFGPSGLADLVAVLGSEGYTVLGPTVRAGAVVPGRVRSLDDLPRGWGDTQEPGSYRLRRRDDDAFFGYAADAISWKAALFPARELVWTARSAPDGFVVDQAHSESGLGEPPYAILGIRSCDLHAVAIHDRVLTGRAHTDPDYARRRDGAFLVTVVCSDPSGTCFCVSTGTGPRADEGYDLALTELLDPEHRFVATPGSERGARVLSLLATRASTQADTAGAEDVLRHSVAHMGRVLDTTDIRDLLHDNAEHPRWDDVAARCLSCGNCTMVCPTCFCTSVDEHTSLSGEQTEHWRIWDSCFSTDFSYLHGGSVRSSPRSRYRQWLTHKVASCSIKVHLRAGVHLFHEGEAADRLLVVRKGRVALDVHVPGRGLQVVSTLDAGDVVGWSWLVPPYRWYYDARAVTDVSAVHVDAVCLRATCDADPALGYALMRRVAEVMYERLQVSRLQMLDVYAVDHVG
jgi:ferredoxin